jgi:hypothetical protein
MAFDPGIDDYDRDLIDPDAFGLDSSDRAKLSELITSSGPRAAKTFLEKKFGTTFEQLDREVEESKRFDAKVEKMTEALQRFSLHFPLWLNTERNRATILKFLNENGLTEFNYKILAAMYEELAGVDGALDLDEISSSTARHYVGQRTPGSELDSDYMPKNRISEMGADEFSRALARSPKFRQKIDGA